MNISSIEYQVERELESTATRLMLKVKDRKPAMENLDAGIQREGHLPGGLAALYDVSEALLVARGNTKKAKHPLNDSIEHSRAVVSDSDTLISGDEIRYFPKLESI